MTKGDIDNLRYELYEVRCELTEIADELRSNHRGVGSEYIAEAIFDINTRLKWARKLLSSYDIADSGE